MNIQELEAKTSSELVALYNSLPGATPTARFSSKQAGIARILKHSKELPKKEELTVVEEPKKGKVGTENLVLDLRHARPTIVRRIRKGSTRGQIIHRLLSKPATFLELLSEFPKVKPIMMSRIVHLAHWWIGYNVVTDAQSRIVLSERL